jgi:hypothetical protein
MKKIKGFMVIALALVLAGPALAQPGPGGGRGGGMGPTVYNPQDVTTVTGQVEKLADLASQGRGGGKAMEYRGVLLKTDQGNLMVNLAPVWFLSEERFVIRSGDKVSATGSKVTIDNQPGLIAREVTVKGRTLKLRDEQGVPVWRKVGSGGGMGQGVKPGGGPGQGPPPR